MSKEPELYVAVESFVSSVPSEIAIPRGMTLPGDHEVVKHHSKFFVPFNLGEQAIVSRRVEIEQAMERLREKQMADLRATRIAQGARPDPSDDMTAEGAKRAVQANGDLELVHDDRTGLVIGARSKAGYTRTS